MKEVIINYTTRIRFIFIIGILIQSCTEDYDIKLNSIDPILVVDGSITDQAMPQYIILMKSAEYFSNEPNPPVSEAIVSVNDGESTYLFNELDELPGFYQSPDGFQGVIGRAYHLLIENVDINSDGIMETYEAESTMKKVAPLDSVTIDYFEEYGSKYWRLRVNAWDPSDTSNFYVFKAYKNDTIVTDQIQEWNPVSDELFEEGQYASEPVIWLEEEDEDGNRRFQAPNLGDVYTLEMDGVTEDYYDYLIAVQLEMQPKVPIFSGPAANVPTNISNGALGYFSVYSVSKSKVVITQDILDLKK